MEARNALDLVPMEVWAADDALLLFQVRRVLYIKMREMKEERLPVDLHVW